MSYCYGQFSKGYVNNLSSIEKLIPNKYLYFECLLNKKILFFSTSNDNLLIYNENGLLKQLNLFKKFKDKFDYFNTKKYGYFFVLRNNLENKKKLCLNIYLDIYKKKNNISNRVLDISEYILRGFKKNTILNTFIYHFIRKYNLKVPSSLNYKEQFKFKKKHLTKTNILKDYKKDFSLDYNKSKKIILKIEKDKDFIKYYKKNLKKYKKKSFDKEIKEIKKSVFFTCKVATKYKKLFPNY